MPATPNTWKVIHLTAAQRNLYGALSTLLASAFRTQFLSGPSNPATPSSSASTIHCLWPVCNNSLGTPKRLAISERLEDLLHFAKTDNSEGFQFALERLWDLVMCNAHKPSWNCGAMATKAFGVGKEQVGIMKAVWKVVEDVLEMKEEKESGCGGNERKHGGLITPTMVSLGKKRGRSDATPGEEEVGHIKKHKQRVSSMASFQPEEAFVKGATFLEDPFITPPGTVNRKSTWPPSIPASPQPFNWPPFGAAGMKPFIDNSITTGPSDQVKDTMVCSYCNTATDWTDGFWGWCKACSSTTFNEKVDTPTDNVDDRGMIQVGAKAGEKTGGDSQKGSFSGVPADPVFHNHSAGFQNSMAVDRNSSNHLGQDFGTNNNIDQAIKHQPASNKQPLCGNGDSFSNGGLFGSSSGLFSGVFGNRNTQVAQAGEKKNSSDNVFGNGLTSNKQAAFGNGGGLFGDGGGLFGKQGSTRSGPQGSGLFDSISKYNQDRSKKGKAKAGIFGASFGDVGASKIDFGDPNEMFSNFARGALFQSGNMNSGVSTPPAFSPTERFPGGLFASAKDSGASAKTNKDFDAEKQKPNFARGIQNGFQQSNGAALMGNGSKQIGPAVFVAMPTLSFGGEQVFDLSRTGDGENQSSFFNGDRAKGNAGHQDLDDAAERSDATSSQAVNFNNFDTQSSFFNGINANNASFQRGPNLQPSTLENSDASPIQSDGFEANGEEYQYSHQQSADHPSSSIHEAREHNILNNQTVVGKQAVVNSGVSAGVSQNRVLEANNNESQQQDLADGKGNAFSRLQQVSDSANFNDWRSMPSQNVNVREIHETDSSIDVGHGPPAVPANINCGAAGKSNSHAPAFPVLEYSMPSAANLQDPHNQNVAAHTGSADNINNTNAAQHVSGLAGLEGNTLEEMFPDIDVEQILNDGELPLFSDNAAFDFDLEKTDDNQIYPQQGSQATQNQQDSIGAPAFRFPQANGIPSGHGRVSAGNASRSSTSTDMERGPFDAALQGLRQPVGAAFNNASA